MATRTDIREITAHRVVHAFNKGSRKCPAHVPSHDRRVPHKKKPSCRSPISGAWKRFTVKSELNL
ncbi:hypothetical protein J6590_077454 [Homalodisca vitripennis]|nr:hypothetical protein J6590_077454 [Homalodisca vitripennis]